MIKLEVEGYIGVDTFMEGVYWSDQGYPVWYVGNEIFIKQIWDLSVWLNKK